MSEAQRQAIAAGRRHQGALSESHKRYAVYGLMGVKSMQCHACICAPKGRACISLPCLLWGSMVAYRGNMHYLASEHTPKFRLGGGFHWSDLPPPHTQGTSRVPFASGTP